MKAEKFELNKKQLAAVASVEKALNRAKNAGLYILAKQTELCFYRQEVYDKGLNCPLADTWKEDLKNPIPHEYILRAVHDSGADDTEYFLKGVIDEN